MKIEFMALFIIYVLVGSLLALFSRRFFRGHLGDYYIAGGRLGALLSAGTYAATTYSAFMMVGLVGMTYGTGIGALGFELLYLASTVFLLSTIGLRIWMLSRSRKWISPSHMLGDLYSSRSIATTTAAIYLFAMIPYLSAQIQGLKTIFNYGGFGEIDALVISSIIVYSWIAIAGMWSVAITDFYQGIIMFTGALCYLIWMIFYNVPSKGISYLDLLGTLTSNGYLGLTSFWSLGVFLAYTIPWMFFAVTNPQVVVRLYIHKDLESYRKSVLLFYIYGFTYTLIVVIVGLTAAGLSQLGLIPSNMPWDSVTPYLLNLMHPLLGSLIAVSIVAGAVSTSNSIVLAVSGSIVSSVHRLNKLLVARIIDAVLVLAAALVASTGAGFIVDLSVLTSVILLPLAPVTILAVLKHGEFSKYTKLAALVSLVAGTLLATYYAITLGPRRAFREMIMGLPLSIWVLVLSSMIMLVGYFIDRQLYNKKV
ncbi:MAG: sodium:solute symporter family protein [Desulfurococcaceae archaeon]